MAERAHEWGGHGGPLMAVADGRLMPVDGAVGFLDETVQPHDPISDGGPHGLGSVGSSV